MRNTTARRSSLVYKGGILRSDASRLSAAKSKTRSAALNCASRLIDTLESRTLLSTTYYVAPTGADSAAGTNAAPFLTLQKAANAVRPGDSVVVRAGTYKGFDLENNGNGLRVTGNANRISFLADPGVTINAPSSSDPQGAGVTINWSDGGADNRICPVTLQGFTIDGSSGSISNDGVYANRCDGFDAINNTVINCKQGQGIFVRYGQNPLIQGNVCHNDGSVNTMHGIYVTDSISGAIIRGNTLYSNAGSGLHTNGDQSSGGDNSGMISNAIIEGNLIHDNGSNEINSDGLRNSIVRNNVIYDPVGPALHIFTVTSSSDSGGNSIYNNTIYSGANQTCIELQSAPNTTVFNNILFGTNLQYTLEVVDGTSLNTLKSDYNLYTDGHLFDGGSSMTLAQWQAAYHQDAHSKVIASNNLAAVFSNPTAHDYHLLSTAIAVDAGTSAFNSVSAPPTDFDGNARPQGAAFDMGAYEYVSGTTDTTPPVVTSESPASGASSVSTTGAIAATFSESVQSSTIVFSLKNASGTAVTGTLTYNDSTHTATFTPSAALGYSTSYAATVSNAQDASGNTMSPVTWNFTTAAAPAPIVTARTPAANATNAPTSTAVTLTFNESIQASTLSFTLADSTGKAVPASVSYNDANHTATLTPTGTLANGTTYSATASGAKDASGTATMTSTTWSFTTAAAAVKPTVTSESPASSTTNVPTNSTAQAVFNESVQASTITMTLATSGGASVAGTLSYSDANHTATFTPSAPLSNSTTYTVTVSGAKDQAGDPMTAPFTWSFTTAAADVAPTVTSESPAPGATNVPVSQDPSVTFSKSVQSATIAFSLADANGNSVSGTTAYDDSTHTVTFTPSAALSNSITYTATIRGAQDGAGTAMTPMNWSFTTAAATTSTTSFTLWSNSTVPSVVNEPDDNAVELGVKFQANEDGFISGIRYYKSAQNTGTHVGNLWTSTGTLLASATFANETSTGWEEVGFATPIPVVAGVTYVASYHTNTGHFADDLNYFSSTYNNGPLSVPASSSASPNGVYIYSSASAFPTNGFQAGNYWVDVVFSPPTTTSPLATVTGRHIFYNDSAFDGNNTAANSADDKAIASDKQALLPGQTATFANYTSFSKGINGVMIDVANLPAGVTLSSSDFTFRIGNTDTPDTWAAAPAPSIINVRRGAGVNGSDRVEIVWPDGEIKDEWLQVTTLVTSNTGLGAPDVFYVGNSVGEVGNAPGSTFVDGSDFAAVRDNTTNFLNPATITNPYDINRDGSVDGTDLVIVRDSANNFLTTLKLISPPATSDNQQQVLMINAAVPASQTAPAAVYSMAASVSGTAGAVLPATGGLARQYRTRLSRRSAPVVKPENVFSSNPLRALAAKRLGSEASS